MTQNWNKTMTIKNWIWLNISEKFAKDVINGYVYVENNILKLSMP